MSSPLMDNAGLVALAEAHWFDAAESMMRQRVLAGDTDPAVALAHEFAAIGHRVISLDAEDFLELAKQAKGRSWSERLSKCCFPVEPRARERGALGSLVPLYELMLEVVQLRAERHEPQALVVTAHLIAEYLCQLAWEPRLGHGGDPLKLPRDVGQRWGTDDPDCPHSSAMRATARRAVNAGKGDLTGYTNYLDKFHSRLGDTLAVCGMNHETIDAGQRPDVGPTCPNPCRWAVAGSLDERRDLDARLRLALIYVESPLVALRHHAPVGHFFGVPSISEISDGWIATWKKLTTPWNDGSNPLLIALDEERYTIPADEALPGLSLLVSVIGKRQIGPGRLLHDIADDIVTVLGHAR
ncbi:hypothetical protein ACQB6R_03000 [Propionibacteriaceae bacterium G1746]|uniref:hypothetical protein n=1 Tax=Aestuariimicrobium sp. G57 TaxID=3418485 RepID=UPI003C295B8B